MQCKVDYTEISSKLSWRASKAVLGGINPLRTVVAYMYQGNKYFTVRKQIVVTSPALTLYTWNQVHFVYYSLLYILLYLAERDNQPEAEKSPSKA